MLKSNLVDSVIEILTESGFRTVDCRGSRTSFDVLAKRDDMLLLVKALANVEGLSRASVAELKAVAIILGGIPVVISERMKSSELVDDTIYDRYGVFVSNSKTLKEIVNDNPPKAYSTRGNYCVHVKAKLLSEIRRHHGLTQESLAKTLGVSKQSVYRYECHGRVSLAVFERLKDFFGDDLIKPDFSLHFEKSTEIKPPNTTVTSFKRMVRREFEEIGFNTALTNAPFDLVASQDDQVFSVVSNDWRRLQNKLSVLEEISDMIGGYRLCVSERKVKTNVSVLSPNELAKIKSPRDLFKLISNQ